MARFSQGVGNVQVTGAAATLRVRWPRGITDGGDTTGIAKFGPQEINGFTQTSFAAGTQATDVAAGAAAVNFKSALGGGAPNSPGIGLGYSRRLSWFTERPGGPLLDGWTCFSFRLTVAYDNPAGVIAGDLGIVLTCGNQNSVNADGLGANAGVIFGPNNVSTITLRARRANAGAQTVTDNVAAGSTPDITKFNTYDLRIVSGSNTSDPVLFGLINGVVVTPRRAWTAAAALLPPPNAVAGNFGYQFWVLNRSAGGVANMHIHEILLTAAQSEGDLD